MLYFKTFALALFLAVVATNSNAQSGAPDSKTADREYPSLTSAAGENSQNKAPSLTIDTAASEKKLTPANTLPLKTNGSNKQEKVVVITGTRFSYPLVQKWIDD